MINVNRMTKAGCNFIFWVADWFALLNNKMGGDLKKIRTVGAYMIEVCNHHKFILYIFNVLIPVRYGRHVVWTCQKWSSDGLQRVSYLIQL